jgi:hypothetical protein
LSVDTNVLEKVSEISPGSLVDVGQDTVLELGVVNLSIVSIHFFVHLSSENVLVSKKILNFALVEWHFVLFSVLHGLLFVLESILKGKVLLLALLSKFLLEVIITSLVNEFISILLHAVEASSLVSN